MTEATNAQNIGTFANPTPAKKMSAKTIIGAVKAAIKAAGGKADVMNEEGTVTEPAQFVPLFRATGQITGIKAGNSTFGEWVAYVGDIWGQNMVTGEVFKGRELFLPSEADIVLREPVTEAVKNGEIVTLGVMIEAKFARTAVGYQYRCKPLQALEQPKSVAQQLLQSFAQPALAAPVKAADESGPQEGQPEPETAKKGKK